MNLKEIKQKNSLLRNELNSLKRSLSALQKSAAELKSHTLAIEFEIRVTERAINEVENEIDKGGER